MKTIFIFLVSLAVILGIFAYVSVFGPPTGSYAVSPLESATGSAISSSSLLGQITSTSTTLNFGPTSTIAISGSSTTASSTSQTPTGPFGTSFGTPPLSWPEGQSKISVQAISMEGNQMTFTLGVQTGPAPQCVPLNLRLIADEEGDLDPPNPASFSFPDTGNCNGTPSHTYTNQSTTFTIDPSMLPLLFTTGGVSNIFFEVATTTGNGLNVLFPGTSG